MHNRHKLDKAFGEGAFGLPDVPTQIGHKLLAAIRQEQTHSGRDDKRSWKRRRKTRWRGK
jgi:hypothetical protein